MSLTVERDTTNSTLASEVLDLKAQRDALDEKIKKGEKKIRKLLDRGERVAADGKEFTLVKQELRSYSVADVLKKFPSMAARFLKVNAAEIKKLSDKEQAGLPFTVKDRTLLRVVPQKD